MIENSTQSSALLSTMWMPTLLILCFTIGLGSKLEDVFLWNRIEFDWPCLKVKQDAIESGYYIPENNVFLGMTKWKNKLFFSIPRWKKGVAVTLAYIQLTKHRDASPKLIPYPNWYMNTLPNEKELQQYENKCNNKELNSKFVSAFRVRADCFDRLWVADVGKMDLNDGVRRITNPTIWIFDLKTDQLIRKYTLKDSDFNDNTVFANICIDSRSEKDTTVYLSDPLGYGLVGYSFRKNTSWRIEHGYFYPDPFAGEYLVQNFLYYWSDGIFGVQLGPIKKDGHRTAYFNSGASTKIFMVSTKVLSNETYGNSFEAFKEFKLIGDRGKNGQSSSSVIDDKTGLLFWGEPNNHRITYWDTTKPFSPFNIRVVDQDFARFGYPSEIIIDSERYLWVLTNRLPIFVYSELDPIDVNIRVMRIAFTDATRGRLK